MDQTFYYGHSFTGSQLGCAAALASLQVFKDEQVLESLPAKVEFLARCLNSLESHPHVKEVRQCGLVAGIEICQSREPLVEFDPSARMGARVCATARRYGLLTRPVLNTLVLMPPLCVAPDQLQRMVESLRLALDDEISAGHYLR